MFIIQFSSVFKYAFFGCSKGRPTGSGMAFVSAPVSSVPIHKYRRDGGGEVEVMEREAGEEREIAREREREREGGGGWRG